MIKNILTKKIVWLLLIAIVAHGFMLFLDGISWDEHTIFSHLSFNEFGVLISWVRGLGFIAGLPAYLGISIKLLFGNNFIFGYRLVAFLSIYLSSVLIYLIMTRSKVLGENESFFIAALSMVYPAVQITYNGAILHYLFCNFVFWLAVYVTLNQVFSQNEQTSKKLCS